MNKVVQFPGNARIREEASHWLVSLEEGLTDEEKPQLAAWLSEDLAHRDALIEQAWLWDELDLLSELSGLYPLAPRETARAHRRKVFLAAAGIAATVIVGCIIAVPWRTLVSRYAQADVSTAVGSQAEGFDALKYRTAVGEQLNARLPDGSTVFINTDSNIEVRYTSQERLVRLVRGEAMFDVAHDDDRPFKVDAGSRVLEAVGTIFNVQRAPTGSIELTVTEGRVRILRAERLDDAAFDGRAEMPTAVTVAVGQVAFIEANEERIRLLSGPDLEARLAWRRGMLIFRGEALAVALSEVERYTPVRFVLRDAKLAGVQVGGYFRTGDVDGVLLALEQSFGIKTHRVSDTRIDLSLQ